MAGMCDQCEGQRRRQRERQSERGVESERGTEKVRAWGSWSESESEIVMQTVRMRNSIYNFAFSFAFFAQKKLSAHVCVCASVCMLN